jgi:ABC-2 type transport system permease protein
VVARREFLERVQSRWFLVVTLLGPVMMGALIVVPAVLATHGASQRTRIGILSHGDAAFGAELATGVRLVDPEIDVETLSPSIPAAEHRRRILKREIDGYLELPADLLAGGRVVYYGANAANLGVVGRLQAAVQIVVVKSRVAATGIPADKLLTAFQAVPFDAIHTTGSSAVRPSSGPALFLLGYAVMFVLYLGIVLYAVAVMRSVIAEKTSRVVEVVVSSIRPSALMAGKIGGVGAVGLVQLGLWLALGGVLLRYRHGLLGLFGVSGDGVAFPSIDATTYLVIVAYFLGGYFFYAAVYAAVGALCTSDQEAQQAQTPVMMLLLIPVVCVQVVANDPRSQASSLLTLLPISSPLLMPMRVLLGGAEVSDVALSLAILALSTALVVVLAARIYRVGILMVGKRATLAEAWRWLRQ